MDTTRTVIRLSSWWNYQAVQCCRHYCTRWPDWRRLVKAKQPGRIFIHGRYLIMSRKQGHSRTNILKYKSKMSRYTLGSCNVLAGALVDWVFGITWRGYAWWMTAHCHVWNNHQWSRKAIIHAIVYGNDVKARKYTDQGTAFKLPQTPYEQHTVVYDQANSFARKWSKSLKASVMQRPLLIWNHTNCSRGMIITTSINTVLCYPCWKGCHQPTTHKVAIASHTISNPLSFSQCICKT